MHSDRIHRALAVLKPIIDGRTPAPEDVDALRAVAAPDEAALPSQEMAREIIRREMEKARKADRSNSQSA